MSASTARIFEDADVAGLSSSIVAVDYREVRREFEGLAFRKRIHAPVMKYGHKRDRCGSAAMFRHVFLGERSDFLLRGKAVCGFA